MPFSCGASDHGVTCDPYFEVAGCSGTVEIRLGMIGALSYHNKHTVDTLEVYGTALLQPFGICPRRGSPVSDSAISHGIGWARSVTVSESPIFDIPVANAGLTRG